MGHRLARQRPELLLPPPATHLPEGQPRADPLRLTDPDLFDYPFIYMIEPGDLSSPRRRSTALRRYLLNGGFLMVDDFWGDYDYENFYQQIKRVFPDREPDELPLDHEIFQLRLPPQGEAADPQHRHRHVRPRPGDHLGTATTATPARSTTGIYDDKGRMMAIICHNTDLGDGWEREGEDPWYFHEFSEKKAYPMGINIITYAMTH